jgi:hypothetical protein
MKTLALILALGVGLHASDSGWIPVTGVVLDPVHQSLRPIQGLPGASLLGPALNLPFAVSTSAILGQKNAAIVIDATGAAQAWLVTGLLSGNISASPLEGAMAGADRIATNDTGTVAVLYSKSSSQLQFVSDLPGSPSVSDPISLTGIHGDIHALAVSQDGGWVLIGATDSGNGAVYRVGPATNNELLLVTTLGDPRAIVLKPGLKSSPDAVIADFATDEVLLVRDVRGAQERILLANGSGGVSGPVAVQVLEDQSIIIANAGSQTIGRVDPVTWQMSTIPVNGVPDRLDRLLQPNAYALNQPGGAPLLLLDASPDLRVVFVPEEQ